MGKTTTKTKAMTVSWRTLARRAAEATNPRQAALLRKEAAVLRRAERARAAAKKAAKKAAKQSSAAKRIAAAASEALDLAVNFDSDARWVKAETPQPVSDAVRAAVLKAKDEVMGRRDDALVCSWLAVVDQRLSLSGLTPWLMESEIIHALNRVLERAGYTAHGRRIDDEAGNSPVGKAA